MERITALPPNYVFVFGSNEQGKHHRGAAKDAIDYFGAIYGQGEGLQGQSYGIPTRRYIDKLETLTLQEINVYVENFILYASNHPSNFFVVTPIGCGYAGYKPKDIAPMFKGVTPNVILPAEFLNA